MSSLHLATCNVEYLFARYRFKDSLRATEDDGFTVSGVVFRIHHGDSKGTTATVCLDAVADNGPKASDHAPPYMDLDLVRGGPA